MKVLYAVNDYPIPSENYIHDEIKYVTEAEGIEVAVWNRIQREETIQDAIARSKPDIVHFHWLNIAEKFMISDLPVTIRGHSFEFAKARVEKLIGRPNVKKIYLFPRHARQFSNPKVVPLTVSFDPTPFVVAGSVPKEKLVFRAGAGLPGKALDEFLRIARLVRIDAPDVSFVLAVTRAKELDYVEALKSMNRNLGSPAEILVDLERQEVAGWMKRAAIYLRSHQINSHAYGMPMSIAEAREAGCWIMSRNLDDAVEYIGNLGSEFYRSEMEAARKIIGKIREVPLIGTSLDQRSTQYHSQNVTWKIVRDWREMVKA